MTTNNFWSSVVHGVAGLIIFAGTFAAMGVPLSWQSMTIGTLIGVAVKWAHLAYVS